MTEQENKITTNLLDDTATDNDEFNSHSKVASAISKLISKEEDGKSIALTGRWGRGKSSIVKMIKADLKGKCEVYVFNAWTHEGDPLRRAFLESLIDYLLNTKWLTDGKKWNGKKDELAKKREDNVINTKTKPTFIGFLLGLLTILLPIGLGLLSRWPGLSLEWHLVGVCLLLLPPITLIFIYIYGKCKKDDDILSVLIDKTNKTVTSTSYKTIDPTSIEFIRLFNEILIEASKNKMNKLLIVIDNLDRIDVKNALLIWSTMRTFFETHTDDVWRKKIWLLVPYDSASIQKLWQKEENGIIDENENNPDNAISLSFTDKTFQVYFETPMPVLSDWEAYFKKCFTKAFVNYDVSDDRKEIMHNIYRMYRIIVAKNENPPTPREIKLFINNLASLYTLWIDSIPLNIQALYIILRKTYWFNEKKIIPDLLKKEPFINSYKENLLPEDYRVLLAALYFGVEKDKARQLLFASTIEQSFKDDNLQSIQELTDLFGFTQALEEVLETNLIDWAIEDPLKICNVALFLGNLSRSDSSINKSWLMVKDSVQKIENWDDLNDNSVLGLIYLIDKYKNQKSLIAKIIETLGNSKGLFQQDTNKTLLLETYNNKKKDSEISKIVKNLCILFKKIIEVGEEQLINEKFRLNCEFHTYNQIILLMVNSDHDENNLQYFLLSFNVDKVLDDLIVRLDNGEINDLRYWTLIKNYNELVLIQDWSLFTSNIKTRLLGTLKININEAAVLYKLLIYLSRYLDSVLEDMKILSTDGNIFDIIHRIDLEKDNEQIGCILYVIFKYNSNIDINENKGNSPSGLVKVNEIISKPNENINKIDDLLKMIGEIEDRSLLIEILKNEKTKELAVFIFTRLADKENGFMYLDNETFLKNESIIYNLFQYDKSLYNKFTKSFVIENNFVDDVINDKFKQNLASLYLAIHEIQSDNLEYNEFLKQGLQEITKEQWLTEEPKPYTNCYDLIVSVGNSLKLDLGVTFYDTLCEFSDKIIKGEPVIEKIIDNWHVLLKALDGSYRTGLVRKYINELLKIPDCSSLLKLYGQDLIDCEILSSKAEDFVSVIFTSFIERKNIVELSWMLDVINKCNIVANASKDSGKILNDKIKGELHSLETNEYEHENVKILIIIADLLMIDWRNPKE